MATSSGVNHYGATVHFLLLCMWLHFVLESFGCWFWYKLWKNGGLENNGGGARGQWREQWRRRLSPLLLPRARHCS